MGEYLIFTLAEEIDNNEDYKEQQQQHQQQGGDSIGE